MENTQYSLTVVGIVNRFWWWDGLLLKLLTMMRIQIWELRREVEPGDFVIVTIFEISREVNNQSRGNDIDGSKINDGIIMRPRRRFFFGFPPIS